MLRFAQEREIHEKHRCESVFCIAQSAKINRHENIHADKNRAVKLVYSKWFLSESRGGVLNFDTGIFQTHPIHVYRISEMYTYSCMIYIILVSMNVCICMPC